MKYKNYRPNIISHKDLNNLFERDPVIKALTKAIEEDVKRLMNGRNGHFFSLKLKEDK